MLFLPPSDSCHLPYYARGLHGAAIPGHSSLIGTITETGRLSLPSRTCGFVDFFIAPQAKNSALSATQVSGRRSRTFPEAPAHPFGGALTKNDRNSLAAVAAPAARLARARSASPSPSLTFSGIVDVGNIVLSFSLSLSFLFVINCAIYQPASVFGFACIIVAHFLACNKIASKH